MSKKILVIGASSGIGRAIATKELQRGNAVFCLARREGELKALSVTFSLAKYLVLDVTNEKSARLAWNTALQELGGLDRIYYASGVMPKLGPMEFDFAKDRQMLEVNLIGAVLFFNLASEFFVKQKFGQIVGISSIAGDRGRRGNPVYNASKAGLNTYLESLRNRLSEHGVQVTTIKPGFVKTAMLDGVQTPNKGLLKPIEVDLAAKQIIKVVDSGKDQAYIPKIWQLVGLILIHIPRFIFKKMNI